MKRTATILTLILVSITPILAQEGGFPNQPADPNGVPIIESIVALLALGGAYTVRLIRNNRQNP